MVCSCSALLANALLAQGPANGTAKMVAMVSLSFALVLLKHALVACFRQWLPVIYKLVC